jgi:hypothetical protein
MSSSLAAAARVFFVTRSLSLPHNFYFSASRQQAKVLSQRYTTRDFKTRCAFFALIVVGQKVTRASHPWRSAAAELRNKCFSPKDTIDAFYCWMCFALLIAGMRNYSICMAWKKSLLLNFFYEENLSSLLLCYIYPRN